MTAADPRLHWQRTSPLAVVFFFIRFARRVATDGLPAIVGLLAVFAASEGAQRNWMLLGLALLLVLGILGSVLGYLRFRFRIVDDRVLVRSGVLHREELNVEFNRVQNVTIREPFYMRPFGLALLSIDTAGSGKKEIVLGGIAKPLAQTLRETILGGERTAETAAEDAPASEIEATVLLQRSTRDIVIYGLTINFFFWAMIALGAVFGAHDLSEAIFEWLSTRIKFEDLLLAAQGEGSGVLGLLIIAALFVAVLLLLPMITVIGALIRHYGYRLSLDGETYRKHSGLLTRHDESLKRHKIQALVWKQNFVARWFGRINIHLRVASAGTGAQGSQVPSGLKPAFLVPALHRSEAIELSANFLPACQTELAIFSSVDRRRYILKNLLLGWFPPIAGIFVIPTLFIDWTIALAVPVALAGAGLMVNQKWKKLGYGVVGEYGFVRTGFVGTQTTVFPLFKVQRIDIRQTPGQRRAGLANLTVHLASHSLTVPYLPMNDAERFRDLALYYMESSNRPWY